MRGGTVPEDGCSEGLQRGPVVEEEVDVIAQQGAEADAEHRGHKEKEQDVKLALSCNIRQPGWLEGNLVPITS